MRAPDLEALIAEGEQEAVNDLGYGLVIEIIQSYGFSSPIVGSDDLHGWAYKLVIGGALSADDMKTVYEAIWSVQRHVQAEQQTSAAYFRPEDWLNGAVALSRRLDNPPTSP
jgi:hypothetical protein